MGTVKKSIEAISVAWSFKNVPHDWDGGLLPRGMYLDTVAWATSRPSLSISPWMRGAPPERILVGDAPDEVSDLMRSTRPPPASALPPPIETEPLAVPPDDRLGLNNGERFAPVPPDAGKHDPYEAVAFLQADPGSRALQDIELVAQSEVLKGEALSGSKYRPEQV